MKKKWFLTGFLLCLLSAALGFSLGIRSTPLEAAALTLNPASAVPEDIPQTLPASLPETAPETLPETVFREVPAAVHTVDTVPQYYQTDYPFLKFGSSNGTIATSGCSLTSLAMVASYITDREYLPDQLVYHFDLEGLNNVQKLELAADTLMLPYTKNFDFTQTRKALEEGKVAIVLENEKSDFTTGQHFIVLAGLNEKGKIIVNDPFRPNYSKEELIPGFENGFTDFAITKGYCGAWVFDKDAMPRDTALYDASKPAAPQTRYTGYELDEEDIALLAGFAWAQARDKGEKVQQAIIEVVLNRLTSEYYNCTVRDIIYGMKGVSHNISAAAPTAVQYRAVRSAMYGPYILPRQVYYFRPWEYAGDMWGSIAGYYFSYTPPEEG